MADVVYMLRHAAPPVDRRGRYWGRADPGVDQEALRKISAVAPLFWNKPMRLLVSPLERAAATAGELAGPLGIEPEIVPDLAESDFGDFDGLTFSEIEKLYPDKAREWGGMLDAFAFPGGESIAEFFARAERAWRFCTELPEESVAAVTHGGVIMAWVCFFLRLPLSDRFSFRPAHGTLSAFVRKKDGTGWEMTFFNNLP